MDRCGLLGGGLSKEYIISFTYKLLLSIVFNCLGPQVRSIPAYEKICILCCNYSSILIGCSSIFNSCFFGNVEFQFIDIVILVLILRSNFSNCQLLSDLEPNTMAHKYTFGAHKKKNREIIEALICSQIGDMDKYLRFPGTIQLLLSSDFNSPLS